MKGHFDPSPDCFRYVLSLPLLLKAPQGSLWRWFPLPGFKKSVMIVKNAQIPYVVFSHLLRFSLPCFS